MIRLSWIIILLFSFSISLCAQIITLNPVSASGEDAVTLIFDASKGNAELKNTDQVYVHMGVIIDKPDGTTWKYVQGNWGKDDGIGKMTNIGNNKWSIAMNPTIRQYFNVPNSENIFRLACVFRNADGSKKGTIAPDKYDWGTVAGNNDFFINLNIDYFLTLNNPVANEGFFSSGSAFSIRATSSSVASSIKIFLDEGNGWEEKTSSLNASISEYEYKVEKTVLLGIQIKATVDGKELELNKSFNVIVIDPTTIAPLPDGLKPGANYDNNDPGKVTLVLIAPEKQFIYVVGDFSDWNAQSPYQMKKTPDGKYFWVEITNLIPDKDYVYQYWIDGKLKIADPYAHQVADPKNDKYIEEDVFPGLPDYKREDLGIASVLRTGQQPYSWSATELSWKRPDVNHLVIYELHIRDFLGSHSYNDLTDTLSYLKRLGVNAIELMPINEFEGNDSWGYNPSFFFAVDKYYGTQQALKRFVETAHENGMAVIMDIVLNHAFGQCPMVQMYFDGDKPATNNPWFNRDYVGQYQWGYDFNHESAYTQQFVDDVTDYWLDEFHLDGFRFDFTKGFTNYAPGGNIDGYDVSRINILKRISGNIWSKHKDAYVIIEHWGTAGEEAQLAAAGMKMWRNKSYDFVPATIGNTTGSFANHDNITHVSFYDSHDERRIAEHCLTEGKSSGSYNIKDTLIMFERVKMAAAFTYLQPGLKMIWQFDELGYDIDINYNGRTGRKPLVWGDNSLGYYQNTLRQHIYTTYQSLLQLRKLIGPDNLYKARTNHKHTGNTRRLVYDTDDLDLVVIGNFGMGNTTINPEFTEKGWWYNYYSGDSVFIDNVTADIPLKTGQWSVYTNRKVSTGFDGVVAVYDNPVTVTPYPFASTDTIHIQLNVNKAWPGDTRGLKNAEKIYMHSGVILNGNGNSNLTNIVGNLKDDGVGLMYRQNDSIWAIDLLPQFYYNIQAGEEINNIGMWFRNEDNTLHGFGFRNRIVYFDVLSAIPVLQIIPDTFDYNSEVTIIYNAAAGNKELAGADKIYMHSGIITQETQVPKGSDWNHITGNWGKDDDIGLMTPVPGHNDLWQINLKLEKYYNLTPKDFPHWIAAVFRNANGTLKGTALPGKHSFGIVDESSLDYFIKNHNTPGNNNIDNTKIIVYPNPVRNQFRVKGIHEKSLISLYNLQGILAKQYYGNEDDEFDVGALNKGMYIYKIHYKDTVIQGKITVM